MVRLAWLLNAPQQVFLSPIAGHNDPLEPALARACGAAVEAMLRAAVAR